LRIGIVSDTHLHCSEEAHQLLRGPLQGVELILHAGDVVAAEVIDALDRIAPVRGVAGNMDLPEVRRRWPEKQEITVGAYRIGLIHGSGPPQGLEQRVLREFSPAIDAVVFGHSHQPLVVRQCNILLINPGSPTDRRFAPCHSVALLDVEPGGLRARLIRI